MASRFPFPIPNGWFQVAYSADLAKGEVAPLRYFGKDLVLFRGEAGAAHLLDAFCPHLGAHLGHGGKVVGDAIQCPFHAWEFSGTGRCVAVPYAKKIPPKASVQPWRLIERNGIVWAWHHGHAESPTWEIPELAEANDEGWTPFKRHEWRVKTHNQEIGENAVDRAHFRYVHGTKNVPDSKLEFDGHIRRASQTFKMNTPRGEQNGKISVEAHGMGCTVTRFTGLCETVLLLSHTPIDEHTVHARFSFTQLRADAEGAKGGVAKGVVNEVIRQMDEDIPIWENKRYVGKPMLCDGDGPIGAYRKWAQQFYS